MIKKLIMILVILMSTLLMYGIEVEYTVFNDLPSSDNDLFMGNGMVFQHRNILFLFRKGQGPWYYKNGEYFPVPEFITGKEFYLKSITHGTSSSCIIGPDKDLYFVLWNIWYEEPFYAYRIEIDKDGNVSAAQVERKDIEFDYKGTSKELYNETMLFRIRGGDITLTEKKYIEQIGWDGFSGIAKKESEQEKYVVEIKDESGKILFSSDNVFPEGVIKRTRWVAVNERRSRVEIVVNIPQKEDTYKIIIASIIYDGVVNDDRVRLRTEPNLKSGTMGYMNMGDKIKVVDASNETEKIGNLESYWYKVRTKDNLEGWMYGAYITLE